MGHGPVIQGLLGFQCVLIILAVSNSISAAEHIRYMGNEEVGSISCFC
jgi:hypothetical protein